MPAPSFWSPGAWALLVLITGGATAVRAQDSVASIPGGNDALSAYDAGAQRVRYAVDLAPLSTSWNNPILVGPILKSSRDLSPAYRTQVVGAVCASPSVLRGTSFPARSFSVWAAPGQGVDPLANAGPASSVVSTGFSTQFVVGAADAALGPSNAVGAVVGRDPSHPFNRLLVERVVAACSRPAPGSPDNGTVSLGAADAFGNLAIRADGYGAAATTVSRVLGDNIIRVALPDRTTGPNALGSSMGVSVASDSAATTFVLGNEPTPTNTPCIASLTGGTFVLAADVASRFRMGSASTGGGGVLTTTSHLPGGISGQRGNPSYCPASLLGGNAGTVALIATAINTQGASVANRLVAFGLSASPGSAPPTVTAGSPRAFTLPSPISSGSGGGGGGGGGFTANASGAASFSQYLSPTLLRGGNGQVGIGSDASGHLVLAGVASDPAMGNFVAVVTATTAAGQTWTVAGFPGMPVLSGPSGAVVGVLGPVDATFSPPAVDRFGNVYFLATWTPSGGSAGVGLFKGVSTPAGYRLERLLSTGQQVLGPNSTRPYVISGLNLSSAGPVAAGTMHSNSIIQDRDNAAWGNSPASIRAFGGAAVPAVITYDNNGTPEMYDVVLFVGPGAGVDCAGDFNGAGGVTVQDIFDFLAAWFASDPRADVNASGGVTVQDIFDFLSFWFAGCS